MSGEKQGQQEVSGPLRWECHASYQDGRGKWQDGSWCGTLHKTRVESDDHCRALNGTPHGFVETFKPFRMEPWFWQRLEGRHG